MEPFVFVDLHIYSCTYKLVTPDVIVGRMANEVAEISVKIPPFWAEQLALWFAQVEAQFLVTGITQDAKEFGHVVGKLEGRFAIEVADIITDPPTLVSMTS